MVGEGLLGGGWGVSGMGTCMCMCMCVGFVAVECDIAVCESGVWGSCCMPVRRVTRSMRVGVDFGQRRSGCGGFGAGATSCRCGPSGCVAGTGCATGVVCVAVVVGSGVAA